MIIRVLRLLPLALAACLALAPASQADRTVELGFEDPAIAPGGSGDPDGTIAQWRSLGVQWVRIQAFWNAISPNPSATSPPPGFNVANHADPRYNWADLDAAVRRVRANGMKVMMTIHQFNPAWASSQPGRGQQGWKPSPRLYGQWATALATRYGSQVDRWLGGNEINQKVFFQPQSNRTAAHTYRALMRAAYPAVKRADRSRDQFLGLELAPIGAIGRNAGNLAPLAFIRALGCLDDRYRRIRTGQCRRFRPAKFDAVGYHPYQVRERPTQPQRNPNLAKLGDIARLTRVLDRLTRSRRITAPRRRFNLYFTEYGYETNPPDARNGVSFARQNRFLQEAAYVMWKAPRVKLYTQYLWRDDFQNVGFQTGLHTSSLQPKPSLASFPDPIFLDQKRGRPPVLWGQVRPGGRNQVRIFRALRGQGFRPFRTLRTDRLGYFTRRGSLARRSRYYFEYTANGAVGRSDTVQAR